MQKAPSASGFPEASCSLKGSGGCFQEGEKDREGGTSTARARKAPTSVQAMFALVCITLHHFASLLPPAQKAPDTSIHSPARARRPACKRWGWHKESSPCSH